MQAPNGLKSLNNLNGLTVRGSGVLTQRLPTLFGPKPLKQFKCGLAFGLDVFSHLFQSFRRLIQKSVEFFLDLLV
jgi:hypothetical protein